MKKAINYSLTIMVVSAGLLLGGSVRADGAAQAVQTQAISATDASARIEQIRQKIAILSSQIKDKQNTATTTQDVPARIAEIKAKIATLTEEIKESQGKPVVAAAKPVLTQAQLDQVEARVKVITSEIARIKNEVRILMQIRAINQKIVLIKAQIAALNSGKAAAAGTVGIANLPVAATASGSATTTEALSKEARIARIKQQIGELTREYQIQKNLEEQNKTAEVVIEEEACPGGSCNATPTLDAGMQKIEISPSSEATKADEPAKKGFWDSVGDFMRKIFTF